MSYTKICAQMLLAKAICDVFLDDNYKHKPYNTLYQSTLGTLGTLCNNRDR